MEHYVVSARKYRPSTFDSVVGQRPLTAALKHAVATNRLAHAYLFCGSRGVGKTSCARIFAKTINCRHRTPEGDACNQCESCLSFNENNSFNIIELDAASHNGVDDIRELNEQVKMQPAEGQYRVFIIDEVHMLSSAAFNAFLKTLEEPPEYVIFILATTEKHKIIPTILSRCQIYDFNRITIQDMVDHLQMVARNEGIEAEPAALNVIARKADGAMRDALSIFDQVAASTLNQITYQATIDNLNILDSAYYSRLVEAFLAQDVATALLINQEIRQKGFDAQFFINGLGQYLRDLMVAQNPATIKLLEASDDVRQKMARDASKCKPEFLYQAMDLCNEADLNYRAATNKQFLIELTLVKLCQLLSPSLDSGAGKGHDQLKPIAAFKTSAPAATPAASLSVVSASAAASSPAVAASAPASASATAAQATAPQMPQSQVPVQHPASPQPAMRAHGKLISISINPNREQPGQQQNPDTAAPAQIRETPFSNEALQQAWQQYIDANPTERILVNTMMYARPRLVSPTQFALEVDDQIQVDTLMEARAGLLRALHDRLQNDRLDFTVSIRQGEASPATWTSRHVLEHMLEEHPDLVDFVRDFKLTLG